MRNKMKSKRSAKKRFKITKNGKVKRNKAFSNHILTKKSQQRKRNYRKSAVMSPADSQNIKKMMPYD